MSVRKSGKNWLVDYRINGKATVKRGFETKRDAKIWESNLNLNKPTASHSVLIFDKVYEEYFENCSLTKAGRYKRRKVDNKWILPQFAGKNIFDISAKEILEYRSMLNKTDLACKTKNMLLEQCRLFFKYAVDFYGMASNPFKNIKPFKDNKPKKEMLFFTREEFETFIHYFDNDIEWKSFFMLLYFTGLRRGEAQALTWKSIKSDIIKVRSSCTYKNGDGKYEIHAPKTKGSARDVLMPDILINQLKALYQYEKNYDGFSDDCFVFGIAAPYADSTIERRKNVACKSTGVKQIRIHDFRHSHASLLINAGASPLLVSQRLGHSSISITLNTYSHLFPNEQVKLMQFLK